MTIRSNTPRGPVLITAGVVIPLPGHEDYDAPNQPTYEKAAERIANLGLSSDLLNDESGQTGDTEHAQWLLSATDSEIREWAAQLG